MRIAQELVIFNKENVDAAPTHLGVYGLYDQFGFPIYYGSSLVSIRERLQRHISGAEGPCTQSAFAFNCELSVFPLIAEEVLLREHKKLYGSLPRCNEVMPSS